MSTFAKHREFHGPLYLVIRDYHRDGFEGVAYPELSRRNIIDDIRDGQTDKVACVLELIDGRYHDITDDIRDAVESPAVEAA